MSDLTPNNVISFPRSPANQVPSTDAVQQKLLEIQQEIKEEEFDIIVDMIGTAYIDLLENAGFYVSGDSGTIKDVCFLLEGVRALIAKYYSIEHPFHDLAEDCFTILDDSKVQFNNPKFQVVKTET